MTERWDEPLIAGALIPPGIEGATGRRSRPLPVDLLARELSRSRPRRIGAARGLVPNTDPIDLASSGWGVLFPSTQRPEVREALAPLLEHRRLQATASGQNLFREYHGKAGLHPGENRVQWTRRQGGGFGPVDPVKVPFYLLLVGNPREIPFELEHQLAVQYAVGRLDFEDPADYARYAQRVVQQERAQTTESWPAITTFAAEHRDDITTRGLLDHLITPWLEACGRQRPHHPHHILTSARASKAALVGALSSAPPKLLVTAGHGLLMGAQAPDQQALQGALVCSGFEPSRERREAVPESSYFAARDLPRTSFDGMVSLHVACFSAGTPATDSFALRESSDGQATIVPTPIAPQPFVAELPKQLLRQGALASVGHVDRAWGWGWVPSRFGAQAHTFHSALEEILAGRPVGYACRFFGERHGELSALLCDHLEQLQTGQISPDDRYLAYLWTARNDARSWTIVGDPAVRLRSPSTAADPALAPSQAARG
ncbi:MAG: hypothetical protein AAF604_22550 [Acidobacteriota bacterium]